MSTRNRYDIGPRLEVCYCGAGRRGMVDIRLDAAVFELVVSPDSTDWSTKFVGDDERPTGKAAVCLDIEQAKELHKALGDAIDAWGDGGQSW